MDGIPTTFAPAPEQPFGVELHFTDKTFLKQVVVPKAGTYLPQHAHHYAHISAVAVGSVRVWKDGNLMGDFKAPAGILIEAHAKHLFLTLEDATQIFCIHQLENGETVESLIAEEHHVLGDA